jgi:tight adherence protein C
MLIVPLLVFVSVTLALTGIALFMSQSKAEHRVRELRDPVRRTNWLQSAAQFASPFARLSAPETDWTTSPVRTKFIRAGLRNPDAMLIFYGAKTLLPLLFGFAAYIAVRGTPNLDGWTLALYVLVPALVGNYLPNMLLNWMIRMRRLEIMDNFPDAADLMLVCVEAGLGLDAALVRVADEMQMKSAALAEELQLTNLEMRAGGTREQSLRNLGMRTGVEAVGTFAAMLTQAEKFGTSIGDSLRVFSDDLRHKRQMRAEELAAKVPTKMLFPLVVCIFPAIVMVIIGPAVIQVIRTLLPMLAHGG